MVAPSLLIRNLTLQVASRKLFRELDLTLPARGLVGVMGPMGVGKSTLLSWLCGTADSSAVSATFDEASIDGRDLTACNRPAMLVQKSARNGTEALRRLREMASCDPRVLCVDEVTATLSPDDAGRVLDWLSTQAQSRLVLMISHNQLQVAAYADWVALLAGGRLQEFTQAKQFFTAPQSEAGRQFIGTGGTTVTSPDTDRRHLNPDLREVPADLEFAKGGPGEDATLRWIVKDQLAVFRPRTKGDVATGELKALSAKGVSSVVIVDGNHPPDLDAMAEAGLVGVWFPMNGESGVQISDCRSLCEECDRLLKSGQKVAVITTSGNRDAERTVAAQLVHMGLPAGLAAEVLRKAFKDRPLSVADEQMLWDLELSNDLADDLEPARRRGRQRRLDRGRAAKGNIATIRRSIRQDDAGRVA